MFQRGLAHVPEGLRQDSPADVPAILAAWTTELGELVEMRGVLRALLRQLASRVSRAPHDPPPVSTWLPGRPGAFCWVPSGQSA